MLPSWSKNPSVFKLYPIYQLDFHPPNKPNLGANAALTVPELSSLKALDVEILPT